VLVTSEKQHSLPGENPHTPVRRMIELRVLGSLTLRASDGKNFEALVRQSKRMALLVYLAVAMPRGFHRRDRLLALFWPELADARARGALNQALYVLRTMLGEDAILTRGDSEVGLNTDRVTCDAVAFETALDERPDDALALYRGDLLDGFFVSDAPAFEQWLETERARLRQRASEGAWSVAEKHADAGRAVDAARWARRASQFSQGDEAVARRLMTFLHRIGDRAAAVRSYEAFAWQLGKEYELEPSSETQALAMALREESTSVKRVELESTPAFLVAIRQRIPIGWAATLFLVLTLLAGGAWTWLSRPTGSSRAVVRFSLSFPDAPPMASGVPGSTIALAPNGSQIVYLATTTSGRELFQRSLDRLEPSLIPDTHGAYLPFFSADGKWLAYVADGSIRKVATSGGAPIVVCSVQSTVYGAGWGDNDVIVFATAAGLWIVSATRGTPRLLAPADTIHGVNYRWPEVLPEARGAVFTVIDSSGFHLAVASLESGSVRHLGMEGTNPHFLSSGHLAFARRDGVLYAATFDVRSLAITGRAEPVEEGINVGIHGAAKLGVSPAGTFAYMPEQLRERSLVTVTRAGAVEPLPLPLQGYHLARYSNDGRRIAAVIHAAAGSRQDIWIIDPARQSLDRLTRDEGSLSPHWSADDKRITYATSSGGRERGFSIRRMSADGADSATLLPAEHGLLPIDVVAGGDALILQRSGLRTARDIWYWTPGNGSPVPYVRTAFDERGATVSPDGRWVAYRSDESGTDEIYVRSFPTPGAPLRVSQHGGHEAQWARNGRELFYRSAEGMVAVTLASTPEAKVLRRDVLFDDAPFFAISDGVAYDIHPDGQRFLMIRRGSQIRELVVVVNLFDQLSATR
jgi:DNA-binding SARP family transcriptional activator